MKRSATADEKRHMARVAQMGCCVCEHMGYGDTPSVVHHVRTQVGWGRDGHMNVIPLCPEHHDGALGIHTLGRTKFQEMYGISEIELLELIKLELGVKD